MSDSLDSPAGFALRTSGVCLATEEDCGKTVAPYRVCCPGGSYCPITYNTDCCPENKNCTSAILERPSCANSSWDLYDNGGYFCCLKGLRGYATTTNSNGCAGPGHTFKSGEVLLDLINQGEEASSSPPTSSASQSSSTGSRTEQTQTTEQSPGPTSGSSESGTESEPDSGSSTNVGAIAGGVVGGVVGLALIAGLVWLFLKRRQKRDAAGTIAAPKDANRPKSAELTPAPAYMAHEAPSQHQVHEAPGRPIYEFPA